MTLDAGFLQTKSTAGLDYAAYLATGNPGQADGWQRAYDQTELTADQRRLVEGFTRDMHVLVVSGIWCGDCAQQGPLLARIAEANPDSIHMRWLDRDEHADLARHLRINAGDRVPVAVFCAEDHELVGWYGDKTLSRYRALAKKQLGASCPLPGAALEKEESAAALADWLREFERVHLLLRLSGRLRQKHGD